MVDRKQTADGATITVLSPHRDDAAFSCGILIQEVSALGVPVDIVNCFTISDYAPLLHTETIRADKIIGFVSDTREKEDASFAALLGDRCQISALGRLDAPIRSGRPFETIFDGAPLSNEDDQEVEEIAAALKQLPARGILLLPLAIGNHIDHRIAREAGLRTRSSKLFAFYEDLPYAATQDDNSIRQYVSDLGNLLSEQLRPVIVRSGRAVELKRRCASLYASQVDPHWVEQIAVYARRYEEGERFWASEGAGNLLLAATTHARAFVG